MKKQLKVLGLMAGIAGAGFVSAQANNELVDTLVKKGYLSASEAKEIGAGGAEFTAKGKHTKKIRFNGQLHFQYDNLDADATNAGTKASAATTNNFYFRRLRLGAQADLGSGWGAETVYDFSGGSQQLDSEVAVDKAIITYKGIPNHKFAFGYQKVPFGLEETTSSTNLKPIERSAVTRVFADDYDFAARHAGVFADGKVGSTGLNYGFALTNTSQSFDSRKADTATAPGAAVADTDAEAANDLAAYGRLQYTQQLKKHGKILIGADVGHQQESSIVPDNDPALNAASPGGAQTTAWTAYAQYDWQTLQLVASYMSGEWENGEAFGGPVKDMEIDGYYLQASYGIGNWEPVIRYSKVTANGDSNIDTDELIRRSPENTGAVGTANELESWYFGVTYYILGNDLKVQAGYEHAEADEPGNDLEIDGIRLRMQLLF